MMRVCPSVLDNPGPEPRRPGPPAAAGAGEPAADPRHRAGRVAPTQYAPSGYVGLWTRLASFERASLTQALEDARSSRPRSCGRRSALISRGEFWRYAMGVREPRRVWARRNPNTPSESELIAQAEAMRAALADGPRTVKELARSARDSSAISACGWTSSGCHRPGRGSGVGRTGSPSRSPGSVLRTPRRRTA